MPGSPDIGVVIAGNRRDQVRRADALEPAQCRRKLGLECEIDEVAGDRDVVGDLGPQVRHQHVEHVAAVIFVPVARPVEVAERALAQELAELRSGQGRQMRIGQMRQREGGHHTTPAGLFPADLSARRRQCTIISRSSQDTL
jgi:hypothetical protein